MLHQYLSTAVPVFFAVIITCNSNALVYKITYLEFILLKIQNYVLCSTSRFIILTLGSIFKDVACVLHCGECSMSVRNIPRKEQLLLTFLLAKLNIGASLKIWAWNTIGQFLNSFEVSNMCFHRFIVQWL